MKITIMTIAAMIVFANPFTTLESGAAQLNELAMHICQGKGGVRLINRDGILTEDLLNIIEDNANKYKADYGNCRSFKIDNKGRSKKNINLYLDNATVIIESEIDRNNLITSIVFADVIVKDDSFKKVREALNKLPGEISAEVRRKDGKEMFTYNSDKPLAIASSFKIFVLRALEDSIQRGELGWGDIIKLKDEYRSYPSGILQDWPNGTPITIATLASLMISASDNTAADILTNILGKETIEKYLTKNGPFLTTKEVFLLKSYIPAYKLNDYLRGDRNRKQEILKSISLKNVAFDNLIDNFNEPRYIDKIEWFATTTEICDAAFAIQNKDIMAINPGVIRKNNKWTYVGYKGGSESGVLQLTQILKSKANYYCISATWNNDIRDVSDQTLITIVKRLANLL